MSSEDGTLNQAWSYVGAGLGTLGFAIIVIIVALCRQCRNEQAIKEQKEAARTVRLSKLQEQINSYTNTAYRSDADILTRLGMAQIQPNPVPAQNSDV